MKLYLFFFWGIDESNDIFELFKFSLSLKLLNIHYIKGRKNYTAF